MKAIETTGHLQQVLKDAIVWDNHACMPLRPEDESFLPQLARHRAAGVNLVSLNVGFDMYPWEHTLTVLASFRRWIGRHSEDYVLAQSVADIEAAKREHKLAVVFDIEEAAPWRRTWDSLRFTTGWAYVGC